MKKYYSTIQNPQNFASLFNSFSKSRKKGQRLSELKNLDIKKTSKNSKSNFNLPSINFHIPSYQLINQQKRNKHQQSLSTPKLQDPSFIDFTMKKVLSKNQKLDAISSKVDFFSTRNQRRLDIKKRKVFIDLGMIRVRKDPVYMQKRRDSSPQILKILQKYINKKEKSQFDQDNYVVVGKQNQSIRSDI